MDQFRAGGINLLYFASCALPALWGHVRRGLVERQAALWAILTGLPACVGAALLAAQLDVTLLRRVFGLFLLAVGLRELFSKPEKGSGGKPRIISQKGRTLLPRPNPAAAPGNPHKGVVTMSILDRIALALVVIGGINWGLVGIFRFDLVAWMFGGQAAIVSRIIYTLVGIAALWCITLIFRGRESVRE